MHRTGDGWKLTPRRWLLLIVMIGALLRVVPVWFGFPYLPARPDETVATGIATRILAGDLNPHFFHWPSLTLYLFAGAFWLAGAGGADPSSAAEFILIARVVVACAGTATIVVLFRLARHVVDERTALVAAALLAVAMLHVRDSHFAMTDIVMTLLTTWSLELLFRALDATGARRSLRWFAAAGIAGGLATSTKYNAAAVAAAMAAAQVVVFARERRVAALLPSLVYAPLFVAAFVLATPYSVLDVGTFTKDLHYDLTHLSGGHGADLGRGWIYHLTRSLPYGLGPTAFLAAIVGFVALIRKHRPYGFVLGTFAAALYISIGSGYTVFFRYILPLIPVMSLAAAVGIRECTDWLAARGERGPRDGIIRPLSLGRRFVGRRPVFVVLLALTIGPGLVNSVWLDVLLARDDSRVVAGEWLTPRLQPHHTLYDAGGDYTALDLSQASFHHWHFDAATSSFRDAGGRTPDWLVMYESALYTHVRTPWQLEALAQTRYRRVHTVRAFTGSRHDAVYDLQDVFFMPVWGFWTVQRPGPTIHIYVRNDLP